MTDNLEQIEPKSFEEIFSVKVPYGAKPFETEHWRQWQEAWFLESSPKERRDFDKSRFIASGYEAADFHRRNPVTEKFKSEVLTYETWVNLEPQYSPKYLHTAAKITNSYKRWLSSKGIPEELDIRQFAFLIEYVNQLAGKQVFKSFNSASLKHPVPPGKSKRVKSKVGNVYGTWKLNRCVSESEHTQHKPYYEAECLACGHTINYFSYSRIAHPCPACAKAGREERFIVSDKKQVEITIWQMPDGVVVQETQPIGAIAKAVQTREGETAPWMKLELEVESDQPPKHLQKQEEPVKEMSEFDKAIMNLDIPGM